MVLADSHRISRVPCYLGNGVLFSISTLYRAITFFGEPFQILLIPVEIIVGYLVLLQTPFPLPQLSNAHML